MNIAAKADLWEKMCSPQAKALWSKSGDEQTHLSLPQHLIDAACVASWLWDNWVCDSLKTTLSKLWGLNETELCALYCFYAGTHDVGKATVTFQKRRPEAQWLIEPLVEEKQSVSFRHTREENSPKMQLVKARYRGCLEVRDPQKLRQVLVGGIGRSKGYGCGLLTLARI